MEKRDVLGWDSDEGSMYWELSESESECGSVWMDERREAKEYETSELEDVKSLERREEGNGEDVEMSARLERGMDVFMERQWQYETLCQNIQGRRVGWRIYKVGPYVVKRIVRFDSSSETRSVWRKWMDWIRNQYTKYISFNTWKRT